jgi:hypothetical protein
MYLKQNRNVTHAFWYQKILSFKRKISATLYLHEVTNKKPRHKISDRVIPFALGVTCWRHAPCKTPCSLFQTAAGDWIIFLARSTCADFFGHGQINRLLSESDGWALTKKVVHSNIGVDLQGFAHTRRDQQKAI